MEIGSETGKSNGFWSGGIVVDADARHVLRASDFHVSIQNRSRYTEIY